MMRKLLSFIMVLTVLAAACSTAPLSPTSTLSVPLVITTPPLRATSQPMATSTAEPGPFAASITHVKGAADERPKEGSGWETAYVGQLLAKDTQVRTSVQSVATLHFTQGTITRLGPESILTVSDLSGEPQNPLIRLQLSLGQLFVLINGSLGAGSVNVETLVGSASVRGSLMNVKVTDNGHMKVACLETSSKCTVENDSGAVELESGQQTEIEAANEPPAPAEQIDEATVAEWFQVNPEAQTIVEEDADGDGFNILNGDCNDGDAAIHPGADDPSGDGVDQNCDGTDGVESDNDGDGFTTFQGDCDDGNAEINPSANDSTRDGIDQNCDGVDGPIEAEVTTETATAEAATLGPDATLTESAATEEPPVTDSAPEAPTPEPPIEPTATP